MAIFDKIQKSWKAFRVIGTKKGAAHSSTSAGLNSAFAEKATESVVKNRSGIKRAYETILGRDTVLRDSLTGIAKQMGYEAGFDMIIDLTLDIAVQMESLDDPSLDSVLKVLASELTPQKQLARVFGGVQEAADVTASDGVIYAAVVISALSAKARRGKVQDGKYGDFEVKSDSRGQNISRKGKVVATMKQVASDPVTWAYIGLAGVGAYEGATGTTILPEGSIKAAGGTVTALAEAAEEFVLGDFGLNPLTIATSETVEKVSDKIESVQKAGQAVGRAVKRLSSDLVGDGASGVNPDLQDPIDSRLSKIAAFQKGKPVRSIF